MREGSTVVVGTIDLAEIPAVVARPVGNSSQTLLRQEVRRDAAEESVQRPKCPKTPATRDERP
eukprot:4698364-Alexandrium_andersonii.AAC.1